MSNAPVTAEDLYLYAMDLLDPEEQNRIQDFLPKSPEARAELANVRGDLALFALGTEPQEVPASSRQRLLQQVAREAKQASVMDLAQAPLPRIDGVIDASASSPAMEAAVLGADTYTSSATSSDPGFPVRLGVQDTEPRRGFFSLLMPWAGWAVAAGLAFTTFTYYQRTKLASDRVSVAYADAAGANARAERETAISARAQEVLETLRSTSAQRFVLTAATVKPVPSARVTYLASTGSLVFQGSNIDQVAADKTYELWLIPKGEGAKPIPAGTFKPDARGFASVILPELPKGTVAAAFGVTLESDGGSKTPTLPILLVGAA
jgi:anti-sigma-K factor RskA